MGTLRTTSLWSGLASAMGSALASSSALGGAGQAGQLDRGRSESVGGSRLWEMPRTWTLRTTSLWSGLASALASALASSSALGGAGQAGQLDRERSESVGGSRLAQAVGTVGATPTWTMGATLAPLGATSLWSALASSSSSSSSALGGDGQAGELERERRASAPLAPLMSAAVSIYS